MQDPLVQIAFDLPPQPVLDPARQESGLAANAKLLISACLGSVLMYCTPRAGNMADHVAHASDGKGGPVAKRFRRVDVFALFGNPSGMAMGERNGPLYVSFARSSDVNSAGDHINTNDETMRLGIVFYDKRHLLAGNGKGVHVQGT